jgi:hypothetical protein
MQFLKIYYSSALIYAHFFIYHQLSLDTIQKVIHNVHIIPTYVLHTIIVSFCHFCIYFKL